MELLIFIINQLSHVDMDMENKVITLAIHTRAKALILQQVLENGGICVYLEELNQSDDSKQKSENFVVKIKESEILLALTIIEKYKLLSYNDKQTLQMDDQRKRILVAVDFSTYSMNACRIAFNIAKEIDAKVKILHVYNNMYFPSHLPFADTLKEKEYISILDRSRKKMLDLCLQIDKNITEGKFPSVNYSYSLREGNIEDEISYFINEYKPMLLLIGRKGENDNQKNILGSVTADIIEMTEVPIMVIPGDSSIKEVRDIKHIAFFTNMRGRDLLSFDFLINHLLPYKDLKITLMHVVTDRSNNTGWTNTELSGLKEYFNQKYPELSIACRLIDGIDVICDIKKFIKDEDVKIVAVNTRRRNLWGRIFIPSSSRKIISSLDVTLLALRGKSFIDM